MDLADRILTLLYRVNKRPEDVLWLGTTGRNGFCQSWEEFVQYAPRGVDYAVFDHDLVIVGDGWWIDFADELWSYHAIPREPDKTRLFTFDLRGNIRNVDDPSVSD